jgi:hypothetical protein
MRVDIVIGTLIVAAHARARTPAERSPSTIDAEENPRAPYPSCRRPN